MSTPTPMTQEESIQKNNPFIPVSVAIGKTVFGLATH